MQGIVSTGPRTLAVQDVEDARLEQPTDVLLRLTSTAICGSDLHIYEGRLGDFTGNLIGHEPLGVVEEVGSAVVSGRKGDRVVVPTHICCGFCACCVQGYSASCLTTHPGKFGAAYGYPNMGGYKGAMTTHVRVPFADANCLRLPGEPGDDWEHDFVMLADAFPSGYHATHLAGVSLGDSVAIYGAGPVGLSALLSAHLRGAGEVYMVDYVPERLQKAEELGAIPINFTLGDPVEQIKALRAHVRKNAAYRGEDPLGGVTCGIDAIGFQARQAGDTSREAPSQVIHDLARLVNPNGRLGIIGVFPETDPGGTDALEKQGDLAVPWGSLFKKGISIGLGRDNDERYNAHLRDLVVAGRLHPGRIVSHRLPLAAAPDAFQKFEARTDGYIKVVLDPQQS